MAKNFKVCYQDGSVKGIRGEPVGHLAVIPGFLLHPPTGSVLPYGEVDPNRLAEYVSKACHREFKAFSALQLGDPVPDELKLAVREAYKSFR